MRAAAQPYGDEAPRNHVMHVTAHALQRYREHVPDATFRDVLLAVAHGVGLAREMAATMTGRALETTRDTYILSAGRRGVFVLKVDEGVLITYLRFGWRQETFARRHWPVAEEMGDG